jgi:hypothetical protein
MLTSFKPANCIGSRPTVFLHVLTCATAVVFVAGCGGASGPPTAPVKGKVTFEGQSVTGGNVTFAPIAEPGKLESGAPATGAVQSDGSFVLGTNTESDGAVIGKHRVSYSPPPESGEAPEWDGVGAPPAAAKSPYLGLIPSQQEVEVKSGDNEVTIDLVRAPVSSPGS